MDSTGRWTCCRNIVFFFWKFQAPQASIRVERPSDFAFIHYSKCFAAEKCYYLAGILGENWPFNKPLAMKGCKICNNIRLDFIAPKCTLLSLNNRSIFSHFFHFSLNIRAIRLRKQTYKIDICHRSVQVFSLGEWMRKKVLVFRKLIEENKGFT